MDWKEALASLSGLPEPEDSNEPISATPEPGNQHEKSSVRHKAPLHVVIEKKGRGGKTVTIVEGFEISDEEIDETARTLRKKLGTGGSSRGGEILIQGERRQEVADILRGMGFKVKG